jgi:Flp pilus assembly protein TadD
MRLLGAHHMREHKYEEARDALLAALSINKLFPGTWFRLGTTAMRLGDWALARRAFTQVTAQEPTDGDGWANLSGVYLRLSDNPSAFRAACEAVKHSRNNWKVSTWFAGVYEYVSGRHAGTHA